FGEPLVSGGGMGWDRVGDCVHSYLAMPYWNFRSTQQQRVANRLIQRWGVGAMITPELVLEAGERWVQWHNQRYKGAEIFTEVPFTWSSPDHQRTQGWFDQLTKLPTAQYVVTDH